jgi:hypothetical protein
MILERRAFVKKFLINYYAVIMMVLFIIYNFVLESLKIGGLIYQMFMLILIVLNTIILTMFGKKIKCKSLVICIYFLIWLFSKNTLQCFFDFSNIIVLCVIGFKENKLIKVISILIALFVTIFFLPLFFAFLLAFGLGFEEEKGISDIYEDMHYYCDNNYEVYSFSLGAMDKFHYSIGKHYEILNIDGIIFISYNERNEKTQLEYENYIESHNCSLVGD